MGANLSAKSRRLPLIEAIEQGTSQISGTFNAASDRLGEGLVLFESLKSCFASLGEQLEGARMDETRANLLRLAAQLRALNARLPAETQMLNDMAGRDVGVSQALAQLQKHLRLVAILARSTRIEAASCDANRGDIGHFTDRIMALTAQARDAVDRCAQGHRRLSSLLADALGQQRAFADHYGSSLASVASRLERSVTGLTEGSKTSVALTTATAARVEKIAFAVGNAVVAMQSGDNIRQRLEHATAALKLSGEEGDFDRVVARLAAEQVREAAVVLDGDIREIDAALAVLEREASAMVQESRAHFGGGEPSSGNVLDALEAELAEASALIGKCDAARETVAVATEALSRIVEEFRQTVTTLTETFEDIVMIGANAGLLAGRLGFSGRGLLVIAGEVKAVAQLIARDATRLGPTFAVLQDAAIALRERERVGAGEMATVNVAMRDSMRQMRDSGSALGDALGGLLKDGANFATIVEGCRDDFAALGPVGETLAASAAALEAGAAPGPASAQAARAVAERLTREVFATYTMAGEREIHQRVCGEFGLRAEGDAARRAA